MEPEYQAISRRKQDEQRSKIPREWLLPEKFKPTSSTRSVVDVVAKCGLLTTHERILTEDYDATALLEELRTGRLKSVDVTKAFCKVLATLLSKMNAPLIYLQLNREQPLPIN